MNRNTVAHTIAFSLIFVATFCGPPKTGHIPVSPKAASKNDAKKEPASHEKSTPGKKGFIDPADLTPYFDDFSAQEAAQALAEDRLSDALLLFDEIARGVSDIILTPRARFIAAYLAERLGDDARALAELPGLAEELPLMADLAYERAACAAHRLGKIEIAIELAKSVDESSTVAPDATMLVADALKTSDRLDEALEAYKHYLEKWPTGKRREEAQSRIVECVTLLIENGTADKSTTKEALEYLARLEAQAPSSHWTEAAKAHEETLLTALGKKAPRKRPESRAARVSYEKAFDLMQKMQHSKAERAFKKVIRLARPGGKLSCQARYGQALVISRQRDRQRAALRFDALSKDCNEPNIRIKSLYRGGKAYQSLGRYNDAIRLFGLIETDFQSHSYADDARLLAARCHLALGDKETFDEKLRTLPLTYPTGDMRAEAMWIMAHEAIKRNALVEAKEVLAQYYQLFPTERGWYSSGRSGYWLGRVEELLGDSTGAAGHYEHVIASAPLTYYMVLAYNRLAAIEEKQAKTLIHELAPESGQPKNLFSEALLKDFKPLSVGIELHRLGLVSLASQELDQLLSRPNLPSEIYWLTAAIMRRAGKFHEAKQITSRADERWKQRYPVGRDHTHWSLSFPTAFEETVNSEASERGLEPGLIWAVMREESGFDPKVESWANAIGLMQLILPTAKLVGNTLGIRVNRRILRRPDVNIRLGCKYLSLLKGKFDGHTALMIAGYNAGEGAVGRWLRARPGDNLDIFIEDIPYDQTRGYAKRVIASFATYLFLYKENRPVLELALNLPTP